MIDFAMKLVGGLKLEIKRLHFRYEDDFFQHQRPFSFGLMIDSISMDNSDSDWDFETLSSVMPIKQRPAYILNVNNLM
jgi:hypothetical protein